MRCSRALFVSALPELKITPPGCISLPVLAFDWKQQGCAPLFTPKQIETQYLTYHQNYVTKFNRLAAGKIEREVLVEDFVKQHATNGLEKDLYYLAAQHFNRSCFWNCITPNGSEMSPELAAAMVRDFGSLDVFQKQFQAASLYDNGFGSGRTWLLYNPTTKRLEIENTGNEGCPIVGGKHPLLVAEVWEHVYFKYYESQRAHYFTDFWKAANWKWSNEQFKSALS